MTGKGQLSHYPFPALYRRHAGIDFEHFRKLTIVIISDSYGNGTDRLIGGEQKLLCLLHAAHSQIVFYTDTCFCLKTLAQIGRAYVEAFGNIAYRQGLRIVFFYMPENLADHPVADIMCLYLLFCQGVDTVQHAGTAFLYGA